MLLLDITMLLLSKDENLVNALDKNKETPLHQAVKRNSHEILDLLLKQPLLDAYIKDKDGNLAIPYATDTLLTFKLLSRDGDTINAQNNRKETLLHKTVKGDSQSFVSFVLGQPSLDATIKDYKGNLPIHYAVKEYHLSTVELLLVNFDVTINAQNYFGQTPLHISIMKERQGMIDFLLQH